MGANMMAMLKATISLAFIVLANVSPVTAQVGYLGVPLSLNMSCEFFPITFHTQDGMVMQLHSNAFRGDDIKTFAAIFRKHDAPYLIEANKIMIPCEYYSDIEFLANLSSKAYAAMAETEK